MKKIFIIVSFSLQMLFAMNCAVSADPQYFNSASNTNSNSFPFNDSGGKEVQLFYQAGALNQPTPSPSGSITSISFYINGTNSSNVTLSNLTIKLGQTTDTQFAGGSLYAGPLSTVYLKSSVTLPASVNTWLTIPLDTPFAYDPTKALIVEVSQTGISAGGISLGVNSGSIYSRNWSVGGSPFVYYSTDYYDYQFGISMGPLVQNTDSKPVPTLTQLGKILADILIAFAAFLILRRNYGH